MDSLLAFAKRVCMQAVLAVFLCGGVVVMQGKPYLIMPLIAGCIVGTACWLVMGYRILKTDGLETDAAKKSMQFGWIIRLLLVLGSLIAAIRISTEVFWAVVVGLFLMSGIMMANAVAYSFNSNVDKK